MEVHRSNIQEILIVRVITLPFTENRGGVGAPLGPQSPSIFHSFLQWVIALWSSPSSATWWLYLDVLGRATEPDPWDPGPCSMPAIWLFLQLIVNLLAFLLIFFGFQSNSNERVLGTQATHTQNTVLTINEHRNVYLFNCGSRHCSTHIPALRVLTCT